MCVNKKVTAILILASTSQGRCQTLKVHVMVVHQKDVIQTLSHDQVCVRVKNPLNQLLTESIPPFKENPPLERPVLPVVLW